MERFLILQPSGGVGWEAQRVDWNKITRADKMITRAEEQQMQRLDEAKLGNANTTT